MAEPKRADVRSERQQLQRAKDLRPAWKPGENPGTRISNHAYKAVTLARRNCPAAILYAASVVQDLTQPTSLRLKAADLILTHGMPRGDNSKYMAEESVGAITINLVMPKDIGAETPLLEGDLTAETPTQGSGD